MFASGKTDMGQTSLPQPAVEATMFSFGLTGMLLSRMAGCLTTESLGTIAAGIFTGCKRGDYPTDSIKVNSKH